MPELDVASAEEAHEPSVALHAKSDFEVRRGKRVTKTWSRAKPAR